MKKKVLFSISLLSIISLITSCEGAKKINSTSNNNHYVTNTGANKIEIVYSIQSIMVDDDGEYHIIAIAKDGKVETLHDLDPKYDINIRVEEFISPSLVMYYSDENLQEGYYKEDLARNHLVLIPKDYKIERFND